MKDGIHILSPTEQALAVSAITTVVLLIADYETARYWPAEMETLRRCWNIDSEQT